MRLYVLHRDSSILCSVCMLYSMQNSLHVVHVIWIEYGDMYSLVKIEKGVYLFL